MRKSRPPRKPRFSVRLRPHHFLSVRGCEPLEALREIDEYVQRYDCRGHSLRQAASDVLDGWADKRELQPFFRQKLMVMVRYDDFADQRAEGIGPEMEHRCGMRWTVNLTDRAMKIFWPDRLDNLPAKVVHHRHGKKRNAV